MTEEQEKEQETGQDSEKKEENVSQEKKEPEIDERAVKYVIDVYSKVWDALDDLNGLEGGFLGEKDVNRVAGYLTIAFMVTGGRVPLTLDEQYRKAGDWVAKTVRSLNTIPVWPSLNEDRDMRDGKDE